MLRPVFHLAPFRKPDQGLWRNRFEAFIVAYENAEWLNNYGTDIAALDTKSTLKPQLRLFNEIANVPATRRAHGLSDIMRQGRCGPCRKRAQLSRARRSWLGWRFSRPY